MSRITPLISLTARDVRITMALGDEPEALAELYQPLGSKTAFFVESQLGARSRIFNIFANDHVSTSFDVRETALEVDAGRVFGSAAALRAGIRSAAGDYRIRVGDPALFPHDNFRQREVFVRFEADELDSVAFPRAGYWAALEWLTSDPSPRSTAENVHQFSVRTQGARTWGRQPLLATLRYDATLSGEAPLHGRFRIGGFRKLSGLARNEMSGQNAARIGVSWYRRIGRLTGFPAFAGLTLHLGADRPRVSRRRPDGRRVRRRLLLARRSILNRCTGRHSPDTGHVGKSADVSHPHGRLSMKTAFQSQKGACHA